MSPAFGSNGHRIATTANGDGPARVVQSPVPPQPATGAAGRVVGTLSSAAVVRGTPAEVWDLIVNVEIADYPQPAFFKLLGIPHPERAEVHSEGVGGERVASFDTGKRFVQRITTWEPPRRYAFTFNPEPGFTVLHVFDLSDGVVQIPSGSYTLEPTGSGTRILLSTQYSIDRRAWVLLPPVLLMLKLFQRYLLRGIERNAAQGQGRSGHG